MIEIQENVHIVCILVRIESQSTVKTEECSISKILITELCADTFKQLHCVLQFCRLYSAIAQLCLVTFQSVLSFVQ